MKVSNNDKLMRAKMFAHQVRGIASELAEYAAEYGSNTVRDKAKDLTDEATELLKVLK